MIKPENWDITDITGKIPYRIALAGGWIDQPFVSCHHPSPPGSMVVVSITPQYRFMDRCGMASSTRQVADRLWNGELPQRNPDELVRELYHAENLDSAEPSGSQDMIGLVYAGISRLDYDYNFEKGVFPVHIETCDDPVVVSWLERVLHILPVVQRAAGYNPLGEKNLDPQWIRKLGKSGQDCFNAITSMSLNRLGKALNDCMDCWEAILPQTLRHETIDLDLKAIIGYYRAHYAGAMYSGCGGGYLYVISAEDVPGSFGLKVRLT